MLKTIREGAIGNPWFFRLIMLAVAAVFAVSMGWWGFGDHQQQGDMIARVEEAKITTKEYQRVYRSRSKRYRELFQDTYDDQALRQRVIDDLVERELWIQEATKMGIMVSDVALKNSVLNMPGFQKEGRFNPEQYQRILAFERYTPESFEARQREVLLVQKAMEIVKDGVVLTPAETMAAEKDNPEDPDPGRAREDRLRQKKERALRAYTIALREKASILIKEELL